MAVFMINICKFNGCGLTFPGLGDLIQHIEDTHIVYPCVPECSPADFLSKEVAQWFIYEFIRTQKLEPLETLLDGKNKGHRAKESISKRKFKNNERIYFTNHPAALSDYDPIVVEQKEQAQPSCIPLSYVLRFFTDAARREGLSDSRKKIIAQSAMGMKCSNSNSSIGSSLQSSTPTGSDMEDEDARSESEDSNDSWTTPEEFSAEFILSLAIKSRVPVVNNKNKNSTVGWIASNTKDNNNVDKPFACPVPGCKKRYKNVNGIKYHSKNGHKKDGKVRKGFKCHCGKSYKTAQGLKTHTSAYHNGANLTTITTPTGEILQIPTSQVTTIQPLRTLTVKQISASSLSSLGLPVKTIQSVVVTTKSANELLNKNYDLDNNKTTTLRVLKDISLPIVKNNSSLHLSSTALQSLATKVEKDNNNSDEVMEVNDSTEIFEEIENVSDFLNNDVLNDQSSLMNMTEVKEQAHSADSDKNKIFKIKMQPEKERLIKLISTDDTEKIQVGHVQIKLPDPKVKLTTIKPTSIKLSSPQVITSLRNRLDSINKNNRTQSQENLGILTPTSSPLTSPDSKSVTHPTKSPPSPVLPLTPVSPVQTAKLTALNNISTSDLRETEKMDTSDSCLEQSNAHPDT